MEWEESYSETQIHYTLVRTFSPVVRINRYKKDGIFENQLEIEKLGHLHKNDIKALADKLLKIHAEI